MGAYVPHKGISRESWRLKNLEHGPSRSVNECKECKRNKFLICSEPTSENSQFELKTLGCSDSEGEGDSNINHSSTETYELFQRECSVPHECGLRTVKENESNHVEELEFKVLQLRHQVAKSSR
jgi:hypothetical protein